MSKWKCEIYGNEFENFHARGFDNKIYCPLCYFKKENQKLETEKEQLNSLVNSCQKEIERLKKQLEVGEEQYNDLVEEKENLQEQLSIKTLQLEEYKKQVDKGLYNVCLPYRTGYNKAVEKKENQQKEFINYLTSYIELLNNKPDLIEEGQQDILKEVFDKFKEIIGNDINVGSKGGKDE